MTSGKIGASSSYVFVFYVILFLVALAVTAAAAAAAAVAAVAAAATAAIAASAAGVFLLSRTAGAGCGRNPSSTIAFFGVGLFVSSCSVSASSSCRHGSR